MQTDYTPKDIERFWNKVDRSGGPDACWIWVGCKRNGYGLFQWKDKPRSSHRVAYTIALGEIPDGLKVLHKCDNRPCCNPKHLFLGTDKDNSDDKIRKGRQRYILSYGEKHGQSKLSRKQVDEIRRRYSFRGKNGEDSRTLARIYGVSPAEILKIVNCETWA